jgi:hypothetical protein
MGLIYTNQNIVHQGADVHQVSLAVDMAHHQLATADL